VVLRPLSFVTDRTRAALTRLRQHPPRHVSASGSGHIGAIRFGPERWTILSENTRVRDNHNPAVRRDRAVSGDSAGTRPALGRVRVAPAARTSNSDLVIQTESFLADPIGALRHYPPGMETEGSGLEMRVAASDLRLSLTLGDVRPNMLSFLEPT
jgi:hypothetical protein